ncbi:MAG TPA: SdrD B-like domain-containing protein [Saprospiraceae bacterium]|nr:SdrD B-like domain-containing protein [Saprospiraceae bacterium]
MGDLRLTQKVITFRSSPSHYLFFILFFLSTGIGIHPRALAQCLSVNGTISGKVCLDQNFDGIKDATDLGLKNINVSLYNVQGGLLRQINTNENGEYSFSGLSATAFYRVEISKPVYLEYTKFSSAFSGEFRLTNAAACDQDFGLINPAHYAPTQNPEIAVTCFVYGESHPNANGETLVKTNYNFKSNSAINKIAMHSQTGSIWGLAYQKSGARLFSAAFIKNGTGLGQLGTGGIYVSDLNAMTTLPFVDLQTLGINTGNVSGISLASCEYSDLVGKTGLGDMDISSDDKFLFVSNLYNKSIVILPTENPTAQNVMELRVPDPGCNARAYAVSALKYKDGKLYVGVTCTAEETKNEFDLTLHVYELDLLSRTFNLVFSTDYGKKYWPKKIDPKANPIVSQWLTDIDFTDQGHMILAIADRSGHTHCVPNAVLTNQYGDVVMVEKTSSGWKLENNGIVGLLYGSGVSNKQGPGGGEFFGEDYWIVGPGLHSEVSMGSVVVLPGSGQVISTVFDPLYESLAGGLHRYSTTNGKRLGAIQLYNRNVSQFGKASGLGDIIVIGTPAPLCIGNKVWLDTDEDGLQDAGEPGIPQIKLSLFDGNCNKIASTTTDGNGNYLFCQDVLGGNVLKYNANYFIVIDDEKFKAEAGKLLINNDSLCLSPVNQSSGALGQDATLGLAPNCSDLLPTIVVKTGLNGQNNYSYDFGFRKCGTKAETPEDPEVEIIDLALIKKLNMKSQIQLNGLIQYDLYIVNQGTKEIAQFELTDYLTDGLLFNASQSLGWTENGGNFKYASNKAIGAGETVVVPIYFNLLRASNVSSIINTAEISSMKDQNGNPLRDIDSVTDTDPNNDSGAEIGTATDNQLDGDGFQDEDDHDREGLIIYDLALIKKVNKLQAIKVGEIVTFQIEVINQGNQAVPHYQVSDYIPSGLQFEASLNPQWTLNGNVASYNSTSAIGAGDRVQINISFKIVSLTPAGLLNTAEISRMSDQNDQPLYDIDSTPDTDPNNDKGGSAADGSNDSIEGNGDDEDDHDREGLSFYDLALINLNSNTTPVNYGELASFEMKVVNQGIAPVACYEITAYIPSGYTFNQSLNPLWTLNGTKVKTTVSKALNPGEQFSVLLKLNVVSNNLSSLVLIGEISSIKNENKEEVIDVDSKQDEIKTNDMGGVLNTVSDNQLDGNGLTDDEDDQDPATVVIHDLAVIIKNDQSTPVKQNATALQHITICNQGNIAVRNVGVTDYMPSGLKLSAKDNNGWFSQGGFLKNRYTGIIEPGNCVTIDILVELNANFNVTDLVNRVEIFEAFDAQGNVISSKDFDSQADMISDNDKGGELNSATDNILDGDGTLDEDDSDPEAVIVVDLALRKEIAANSIVKYKGTLDYSITVFNQSNIEVKDVVVSDYLPSGLALSDEALNAGWTMNQSNAEYTIKETIKAGQSKVVAIRLKILESYNEKTLLNYAEISSFKNLSGQDLSNFDYDSQADRILGNDVGGVWNGLTDGLITDHGTVDEDDHDVAGINVVDLAMLKRVDDPSRLYRFKDTVRFYFDIFNQGSEVINRFDLVDYIDTTYTFYKEINSNWTYNPDRKAYFTFKGELKPGEKYTTSIALIITTKRKEFKFCNGAEISRIYNINGVDLIDYDSHADNTPTNDNNNDNGVDLNAVDDHGELDEDDHDYACSNPENFDLALAKSINSRLVVRGQPVQFRIEVINQGSIPATEIQLVDYLPGDLTITDPEWKPTADKSKWFYTASITNGKLPADGLQYGDTLIVLVNAKVSENNRLNLIINRAEIYKAINVLGIRDEDSVPDDDATNDMGGIPFSDKDKDGYAPVSDPGDLTNDEDDADPAGIYLVTIEEEECVCLDNATNDSNGQFSSCFSFESLHGDIWKVKSATGMYLTSSLAPPVAPISFPVGTEIPGIQVSSYTDLFNFCVITVDNSPFDVVLENQYGDKINYNSRACGYDAPHLTDGHSPVCQNSDVKYSVPFDPNSTYLWTVSPGGTITSGANTNAVNVRWSGTVGSSEQLFLKQTLAGACLEPLYLTVEIQNSTPEQMNCIGELQVSLDSKCQALITPQNLLAGGPYDYNNYAVILMDKKGYIIPNSLITSDYIGQTITAKVMNICDQNTCWSKIGVEDKKRPTIQCFNDTIICINMDSYLKPYVYDNCTNRPEKILVDEFIENTTCNVNYSKIIHRKYIAKDASGNTSDTCDMDVFLKRIDLDSIVWPDSFVVRYNTALVCNTFDTDSLGHPEVWVTGVPAIMNRHLYPKVNDKYCDYGIKYEDYELPSGKTCTRKLLRTWEVLTWTCSAINKRVYLQYIEIIDNQAPTIMCPYDINATTEGAYTCTALVNIPEIQTFDSCGSAVVVDLVYPGGFIHDFKGGAVRLPVGENVLKVRAYDVCLNVDSCEFRVFVSDKTPPVALCDRETTVALDRFGEAWVPAHVFDDGSYDDCHIKDFKVRRMDNGVKCNLNSTVFADSVGFCCADIGSNVVVIFKVTDQHGNENTCMVNVEVQDKTIPYIYCPHDITISCDRHFDRNDLSEFGEAKVSANCAVTLREVDSFDINQCREGYIDRIFIAETASDKAVCVQRISIINEHPFTEADIYWPKDFDTTTCASNALDPNSLPDTLGNPIFVEDFCDLVGVSHKDQLFRFVNGSDACYKLIRTWKVINWCRLDNNGSPVIWQHTQVIKVNNLEKPTITSGCEDKKFFVQDTACFGGYVTLGSTAVDDCTPADQLIWEFSIDYNSDGIIDSIKHGVGGSIDASGYYPLGDHRIKYSFEDLCGNREVCERPFSIINLKKPVAYCKYGLSANLVPMDLNNDGRIDAEMVTIWAKDFDHGSYHPCKYPITYSFGTDTTVKSITYDCDSIGRREITLCVTATNGQQDCCTSYIDIQSNNNTSVCSCAKFPPDLHFSDCRDNFEPDVINSRPTHGNCICTFNRISHSDSIATGVPGYCFVIHRTWQVIFDCPNEGEWAITRVQKIFVTTDLKESDITWPSDSVVVDNCVGRYDTATIGHTPRFCTYNGQVMVRFTDRIISTEPSCTIVERNWTVFSKCVASQTYHFRQVLKIINFTGVKYKVPDDILVTDCKKPLLPDSLNGYPTTNCPCDIVNHTYRDSVVTGQANTCYVVYRIWRSVYNCPPDVVGTFTAIQKITVRIDIRPQDIRWPSDSVVVTNCGGKIDTSIIGNVPRLLKDFCGYATISFNDQVLSSNDTCRIVQRLWLVSNNCTSGASRQQYQFRQVLKILYPNGPKLILPPNLTVTDCRKPFLPDSLNGYPRINCQACDSLSFSYRDDTVRVNPEICYQVNRTWSVRVRCRPTIDTVLTGVQVIIRDVNLDPADIIWPRDSFTSYTCTPTTAPQFTGTPSLRKDYCGLIRFSFTDSLANGGECRTIRRTWTARNDCSASQVFRFTQYIITKNQTPPSIQCPNDTIVNADPNACGATVNLANPRILTACNGNVQFTRNPSSNFFPVGMTNVVFTATDSCNNVSRCTTKVTVIESIPPSITCPRDTTVPCSVNTNDLSQFGNAQATDNCPGVMVKDTAIRNQNICGIGSITRIFTATDASGNSRSCTQIITINNPNPVDSIDIIWPQSPVTVQECDDIDPSTLGVPVLGGNVSCAKLRITYADTNQCKIRRRCEIDRTWNVFDSCSNRSFNFVQLIIRNDNQPPTIEGIKDTTLFASDTACNNYLFMVARSGDCDSNLVVITNDSPYGVDSLKNISGYYPVGTTVVTFFAEDACCNQVTRTIRITVSDTILPDVTCRKVVKPILDNGCADYNARDFIRHISDNCSDSISIMASFDVSNFNDTLFTICCDSIRFGEYTAPVTVYFKDEAGNIDSCQTLFQAVDQDSICPQTSFLASIKGLIQTRKEVSMRDVEVDLTQGSSQKTLTDETGLYGFLNMPLGGSYQIKPKHDVDPLNGVTTYDIIQIQKHILGVKYFDDPKQYIAADVNKSKSITTADITEIRKLILGRIDRFSKNESWRFLNQNYMFQDPEYPLDEEFEEAIDIPVLNKNYFSQFIGIKIGDIDDSNKPNGIQGGINSFRSNRTIPIVLAEQTWAKGSQAKVVISLPTELGVEGSQFALELDPLLASNIKLEFDPNNLIQAEHVNLDRINEGLILVSWDAIQPKSGNAQAGLSISFDLLKDAQLSEIVSLRNNVLIPELYLSNSDIANINLEVRDQISNIVNSLVVYQNLPNPFTNSTIIPFQIQKDAEVILSITDLAGRRIVQRKQYYHRGYHEIEISKKELLTKGIYYYHIQTSNEKISRRMILID